MCCTHDSTHKTRHRFLHVTADSKTNANTPRVYPFLHVTSRQLFLWQCATWPQWLADRSILHAGRSNDSAGVKATCTIHSPRQALTLFQWQCSTWHEWLAETQTVRSSTLAGQMTRPESRSDQRLQVNLDPFWREWERLENLRSHYLKKSIVHIAEK